jgi:hypothetical protein
MANAKTSDQRLAFLELGFIQELYHGFVGLLVKSNFFTVPRWQAREHDRRLASEFAPYY